MTKHEGLEGYSAGVLFGGINRVLPETRTAGSINDDTVAKLNEIRQLVEAADLSFVVAETGAGYVDLRVANRPYRLWEPWDDPRNDRIRALVGEGREGDQEQVPVVPVDRDGVDSALAPGRDSHIEVDHDVVSHSVPTEPDGDFSDQAAQSTRSDVHQQSESEIHAPEVRVGDGATAEPDGPVPVHEPLSTVSIPVKRTLSAEHLQKLAEGRERARHKRAEQAKGE